MLPFDYVDGAVSLLGLGVPKQFDYSGAASSWVVAPACPGALPCDRCAWVAMSFLIDQPPPGLGGGHFSTRSYVLPVCFFSFSSPLL
jgi:hypothetical protein